MKEKKIEIKDSKYFECAQCKLKYKYEMFSNYKDKKTNICILEDVYYMKDPFEHVLSIPLILGGTCSHCNITVCVNPKCSVFYSKRFCSTCFKKNIDNFPEELKKLRTL